MGKDMAVAERNVEHGLDSVGAERKVELSLRDALYAFKVLGEFVRFFHQPDHWRTLADVERFIGNKNEGGLHVLCEAYYGRLRDVWPPDIEKAFDEGTIDHPYLDGSG
jgi:hypothetical protein